MPVTTRSKKTSVPVAVGLGSVRSHLPAMQQNRLLASLPHELLENWLPDLEFLQMPLGRVLYESREIEK